MVKDLGQERALGYPGGPCGGQGPSRAVIRTKGQGCWLCGWGKGREPGAVAAPREAGDVPPEPAEPALPTCDFGL